MVSVIVPVYNIEKYISICVESLLMQTYSEIEIILVDDGSTDSSGQICDEFAMRDSRIKVIHKKNEGQVKARSAGMELSTGSYITCVDGDDWLEENAILKILDEGYGADVICFAVTEEYEDGTNGRKKNTVKEGLYTKNEELYELYSKMLMNGNFFEMGILPYLWGKLIKRDLLIRCQKEVPDNLFYAEDVACIYPCILEAGSVYVSNETLYHYRIHGASMVGKEVTLEKLNSVFRTLERSFQQHLMAESLRKQLEYYKWQSLLLKRYSDLTGFMPLFPFPMVKEGMRVAVYGAGLFGRVIKEYCETSDNLILAGWFDKRYESYVQQGLEVRSDTEVKKAEFDILVIAILNVNLAKEIIAAFLKQGVPEEKMAYVQTKVLGRNAKYIMQLLSESAK